MICYNCESKRLVCDVERDAYICQDCGHAHPKQYFFISHSHKDIEKVRIIRNLIEETFFYEPILFFLKCLSDRSEIEDLIKREIDERIWFVYCNSEHAEKSSYVQFERAYIEEARANGKQFHILHIELDKFNIWDEECYDYIRSQIAYKIRKAKIFCSYTQRTRALFGALRSRLAESGFETWGVDLLAANDGFFQSVKQAISKHSYKDGVFLCTVAEDFLRSRYAQQELKEALDAGAFVLPVFVAEDDVARRAVARSFYEQYPALCDRQCFYMSDLTSDETIMEIVRFLQDM